MTENDREWLGMTEKDWEWPLKFKCLMIFESINEQQHIYTCFIQVFAWLQDILRNVEKRKRQNGDFNASI